jgi:hypothetical protein
MWDRNRSWVLIPYTIGPGSRPPNEAMNSINVLHLTRPAQRKCATRVQIQAIGVKERNRLFVGGDEVEL